MLIKLKCVGFGWGRRRQACVPAPSHPTHPPIPSLTLSSPSLPSPPSLPHINPHHTNQQAVVKRSTDLVDAVFDLVQGRV